MTRETRTRTEWKDDLKIGARVRHARLLEGLTMRELAERAGCDFSMISRIEGDKAMPSLTVLHRIAGALDHDLASFFGADLSSLPFVLKDGERVISTPDASRFSSGVSFERLVPNGGASVLDGNIHRVEPGGGTSSQISQRGETIGYVLEGTLELTIETGRYRLEPGDSFFFKNHLTSSYRNVGAVCAKILWINTPRIP